MDMIEEILSDVKKAEQQAAVIRQQAEQKSDAIRAQADAMAAEQIETAKKNAKNYKNAEIEAAERDSDMKSALFAARTTAECEKLKSEYAAKAENLSDEVFRRVLDGNC